MGKIARASVHCWHCEGSGMMGKISIAGIKSLQTCRYCQGVGRIRARIGSEDYIKGNKVSGIGLGKRIRRK